MDQKASQYETIWNAEDGDHEFLSETDVDESQEKQWRCEEGSTIKWARPRGILSTLRTYRWMIDTSLLVVITGLLLLLVLRGPKQSETRQVGGDITAPNRQISTTVIKWNADESFVPSNTSEFFEDALVARWNTLMPAGTSPPGGPASGTFSATSMTHQLHCLLMMGRIYSALESNTSDRLPEDYQTHYLHCIDYLRQAVMCAGDVSLEPHSPNDGLDNGPLDGGWNGIHVCKNYHQVINYLEGEIQAGTRIVLPIDD